MLTEKHHLRKKKSPLEQSRRNITIVYLTDGIRVSSELHAAQLDPRPLSIKLRGPDECYMNSQRTMN